MFPGLCLHCFLSQEYPVPHLPQQYPSELSTATSQPQGTFSVSQPQQGPTLSCSGTCTSHCAYIVWNLPQLFRSLSPSLDFELLRTGNIFFLANVYTNTLLLKKYLLNSTSSLNPHVAYYLIIKISPKLSSSHPFPMGCTLHLWANRSPHCLKCTAFHF